MVAKEEEGVVRGMTWEVGVSTCKLLYTEGINNKVLLCSTENYIQCPMINHNGKEYIYIYIYVVFLGLHLWYMDVPRPWVELEL